MNVESQQETDAAKICQGMNGKNIVVKAAAERCLRKCEAQIAEKIENKPEKQGNNQFTGRDFKRFVSFSVISAGQVSNAENKSVNQHKAQSGKPEGIGEMENCQNQIKNLPFKGSCKFPEDKGKDSCIKGFFPVRIDCGKKIEKNQTENEQHGYDIEQIINAVCCIHKAGETNIIKQGNGKQFLERKTPSVDRYQNAGADKIAESVIYTWRVAEINGRHAHLLTSLR